MGGGLTISPAVGAQQNGALTRSSRGPPSPAVPSGADRLRSQGQQAVKSGPVSPDQHGHRKILHHPNFHGPSARNGRNSHSASGDLSCIPVDTCYGEEGFTLHTWNENMGLYQTDRTAGIQDGPEWLSVNLHLHFGSSNRQVAMHYAACQPGPGGKRGSSCGVGTAGLLVGRWVPSGARRS